MIDIFFDKQIKRNFSVATIWVSGGSDMDSEYQKGINHVLCSLITRGCEGFDDLAPFASVGLLSKSWLWFCFFARRPKRCAFFLPMHSFRNHFD